MGDTERPEPELRGHNSENERSLAAVSSNSFDASTSRDGSRPDGHVASGSTRARSFEPAS